MIAPNVEYKDLRKRRRKNSVATINSHESEAFQYLFGNWQAKCHIWTTKTVSSEMSVDNYKYGTLWMTKIKTNFINRRVKNQPETQGLSNKKHAIMGWGLLE